MAVRNDIAQEEGSKSKAKGDEAAESAGEEKGKVVATTDNEC